MIKAKYMKKAIGFIGVLLIIIIAVSMYACSSDEDDSGIEETLKTAVFLASAQSCPDNNHPHAVDLGLPSGTKWACCNVDTDFPEQQSPSHIGGYYAWGETDTKSEYTWSNYIHCNGSIETCHNIGGDITGSEYDVAHVHWGGSWVMPSQEQFLELISNSSYTGATVNGMDGGLFTGANGRTIFLPDADIRWNEFIECLVTGGYYWSSTQSPYNGYAYHFNCDFKWGGGFGSSSRGHGLTVRPVISGTNNIFLPETYTDDIN